MTKNPAPKPQDDPEQAKRFIDAAKELGANEAEGSFDKTFDKIAMQRAIKPVPQEKS